MAATQATQTENGRNRMAQSWDRSTDVVREHPLGSTSLAFGLGIGVGFLLVQMMHFEPEARRRRDFTSSAHQLGSKIFDAVRQAVPETLARHLPHV